MTEDIRGFDECPCTHAAAQHGVNRGQPVTVAPTEIRPGDGMQDLGRLRRVEQVHVVHDTISSETVALVRFDDPGDGPYSSLSIHGNVHVVVWRAFDEG